MIWLLQQIQSRLQFSVPFIAVHFLNFSVSLCSVTYQRRDAHSSLDLWIKKNFKIELEEYTLKVPWFQDYFMYDRPLHISIYWKEWSFICFVGFDICEGKFGGKYLCSIYIITSIQALEINKSYWYPSFNYFCSYNVLWMLERNIRVI